MFEYLSGGLNNKGEEEEGGGEGGEEAVEAVEDAAVAGHDITAVFDGAVAFEHGLDEVAEGAGDA